MKNSPMIYRLPFAEKNVHEAGDQRPLSRGSQHESLG